MISKQIESTLNKFIKCMGTNSPLKYGDNDDPELKSYRYPYKPALIIAILYENKNPELLFNHDIDLSNLSNRIFRNYYDLLTNSATFYEYLLKQNSKDGWDRTYNNKEVIKTVRDNIFINPAVKLVREDSSFWKCNKKNYTVRMELDTSNLQREELLSIKNRLLDAALSRIQECIPEYQGYSLHELLTYYDTIQSIPQSSGHQNISYACLVKDRKQRNHIYAKFVKERDSKCVICCNENPLVIQACHFKPFAKCENQYEESDIDNGITLCANHHILFDRGYFTFDNQWKVITSTKWRTDDLDLFIRSLESCYDKSNYRRAIPNHYLKYHRDNIFLR